MAEAHLVAGVSTLVCAVLAMTVNSKVASSANVLAVMVLSTISVVAFYASDASSFPSDGATLGTALYLLMVEQQY